MSERFAIGHAVDLPDGARGWRRFAEPESVGRITVQIRWNRTCRRKFQAAVAQLRLAVTPVEHIGDGKNQAASFSVCGALAELAELAQMPFVEQVVGISGKYGTRVHSESAVPRFGCGTTAVK